MKVESIIVGEETSFLGISFVGDRCSRDRQCTSIVFRGGTRTWCCNIERERRRNVPALGRLRVDDAVNHSYVSHALYSILVCG